ncbi:cytochrome ubiquinol oxidase subunit I, partial [Cronobacter turicensis]
IAMLAGWVVTETGRQPWTVYGQLLTRESASPIAPSLVLGSFVAIVVVYLLVFALGMGFMLRLLAKPPGNDTPDANPAVAAQTGSGVTPRSLRGHSDD